jgi:N-acetylmuramoyl-L-alanine amidase
MIEGLRFGGAGEKNRIVIDFNSAPDFRAFLLDNPLRLAVDLPAAEWRTARNSLAGQSLISGYRSGILEKTGLIRIIFDLRKPAIVSGAFVLPRGSMSKDRVVIDLLPSSRNLFAARRADIYGNKNLKNTVQTYTLLPPASETAAIRNRDMEKIPLPTAKPTAATSKEKDHVYTVVIDAGHGGDDPGAISSGLQEKNITLSVAKELQRQLQEKGRYKVVMTRDHDYYIKLRDRLAISRRVMGDLFVSIHADKVARQGIRGASIYTLSENASDNETARLADDENNAGVVAGVDLKEESQDVAGILLDLAMREKMNESNVLASAVVEAFRRKSVQLLPNSHRSAGFAVLKAPDVPAILIET